MNAGSAGVGCGATAVEIRVAEKTRHPHARTDSNTWSTSFSGIPVHGEPRGRHRHGSTAPPPAVRFRAAPREGSALSRSATPATTRVRDNVPTGVDPRHAGHAVPDTRPVRRRHATPCGLAPRAGKHLPW